MGFQDFHPSLQPEELLWAGPKRIASARFPDPNLDATDLHGKNLLAQQNPSSLQFDSEEKPCFGQTNES